MRRAGTRRSRLHVSLAMKRFALLSLVFALASADPASAKEFRTLVVVGTAGDSIELSRPPALADSLFDAANRLNRGRRFGTVGARGSYVRIYPLAAGGHVGVPGRFYPLTGAVCLSWAQGTQGKPCQRPNRTLLEALRASSRRLVHFRGHSVALARLENPRLSGPLRNQLRIAIELAFDRSRRAVRARRPRNCIAFRATWQTDRGLRPQRFCLGERGVHAAGRLYPLGRAPWDLARLNLRPS
jgi:hypothetical protein